MNILKINQEVLQDMLGTKRTSFSYCYDDRLYIQVDPEVGYFLDKGQMLVNLGGAQQAYPYDPKEVVAPKNLLVGTDEYRIGGTVRKYLHQNGTAVYIQTGLLKHFDAPVLYHTEGSPVVVTEDAKDRWSVVGMVAEYIMKQEEDHG